MNQIVIKAYHYQVDEYQAAHSLQPTSTKRCKSQDFLVQHVQLHPSISRTDQFANLHTRLCQSKNNLWSSLPCTHTPLTSCSKAPLVAAANAAEGTGECAATRSRCWPNTLGPVEPPSGTADKLENMTNKSQTW